MELSLHECKFVNEDGLEFYVYRVAGKANYRVNIVHLGAGYVYCVQARSHRKAAEQAFALYDNPETRKKIR